MKRYFGTLAFFGFMAVALLGRAESKARIVGSVAFITRGQFLDVLDLGDLDHPVKIRELDLSSEILDLDTTQTLLFTMAGGQVTTFDISNPANPVQTRTTTIPPGVDYKGFRAITTSQAAFRADHSILLLDLDDPQQGYTFPYALPVIYCMETTSRRLYKYASYPVSHGLSIYEFNGVGAPTLKFATGELRVQAMKPLGDLLVLIDEYGYFRIYKIGLTGALSYVKGLAMNGSGLEISGSTAIIDEQGQAFRRIDFSDPANPAIRATFASAHLQPRLVAFSGTVALLADIDGYQVLDLSLPDTLIARGRYPDTRNAAGRAWRKFQ